MTHFVQHTRNMGLARSFRDGVDYALAHGADIVVNTDGDNQYSQDRIGDLVAPILARDADIVIGDRQTSTIAHFSPFKRVMQRVGSAIVNAAASTELPDAASGFRAYSRTSLLRLNIVTQFSYTMETIIQAGNKRLRIANVPVVTNAKTRESRLFKNIFQHMGRSAAAIARSYLMLKPLVSFVTPAVFFGIIGTIPLIRFVVLWFIGWGHRRAHPVAAARLDHGRLGAAPCRARGALRPGADGRRAVRGAARADRGDAVLPLTVAGPSPVPGGGAVRGNGLVGGVRPGVVL